MITRVQNKCLITKSYMRQKLDETFKRLWLLAKLPYKEAKMTVDALIQKIMKVYDMTIREQKLLLKYE